MNVMPRYRELLSIIPADRPSCGLFLASLLAEAAYFHYDGSVYESVREYLGLDSLTWHQTPSDLTVNYVLGIAQDATLVAFSGTDSWKQIVAYSLVSVLRDDEVSVFGSLHAAFMQIAARAYDHLMQRLTPSQRLQPVVLIGHSLGGAVAQIIAFWQQFLFQLPVLQFITFGSPAIAGEEVNQILERVPKVMLRNDGDIVPYLPPGTGLIGRINIGVPIAYWFYRYRRIQPQLVCSPGNVFELRNFPPVEKGWVGIIATIALVLNANNPAGDANAQIFADARLQHSMLAYMSNLYSALVARNSPDDQQCLTPFLRALYARLLALHLDPQNPSLMPDAQFAAFLNSLNLPASAILTAQNPDDPYIVFEAWLAGTRSDVTFRLGLFTNSLPATVPDPSYFQEPTFAGYRSFGVDAITQRSVTPGQSGRVGTGYLTWHVAKDGSSPDVLGLYVVLSIAGRSWVFAVDMFPSPARLQAEGDCLGLTVDLWTLRRTFTPAPQMRTSAEIAAKGELADAAKDDYGQVFIQTKFLPCNGTSTNALDVVFQDSWPPRGGSGPLPGGQGGLRTFWHFRGEDRRLLEKAKQCLIAIRDLAASAKPSRQQIVPPEDAETRGSLDNLIDQFAFLLQIARVS